MSSKLFDIDFYKAKHLYEIKFDNTSIDNFIIGLKKEFGDIFKAISVRGLTAGKNEFGFKQLPYGFTQKALCWEDPITYNKNTREYYLKLYVDYDKYPFRICNMDWVPDVDSKFKAGNEADFYYNRDRAFDLIENYFMENTLFFMVSVFCGIVPQSSWSSRCYIKVIIRLPVSGIDLFMHSGVNNLTDFGNNNIEEIKREFSRIVDSEGYDLRKLFNSKRERERIARIAENIVRAENGIKNVGDAYVNETLLANYTKILFSDTIRQYSPQWLGKYILDIYVPSKKLAIEYHGKQHFIPVKRFGGEAKLIKQKERDEVVRLKCRENNIILIEWPYSLKVTQENVIQEYSKYIQI